MNTGYLIATYNEHMLSMRQTTQSTCAHQFELAKLQAMKDLIGVLPLPLP